MGSRTDKPQLQDPFIMPSRISIGDKQSIPIFIGRNIDQEVAKNESDLEDDKYKLLILKYDANKDTLVEQTEGTLEQEEEPKTLLQSADWFGKHETTHLKVTWAKVQRAFITRFNEIKSEGQIVVILQYAKQKKYELVEVYYDRFL